MRKIDLEIIWTEVYLDALRHSLNSGNLLRANEFANGIANKTIIDFRRNFRRKIKKENR